MGASIFLAFLGSFLINLVRHMTAFSAWYGSTTTPTTSPTPSWTSSLCVTLKWPYDRVSSCIGQQPASWDASSILARKYYFSQFPLKFTYWNTFMYICECFTNSYFLRNFESHCMHTILLILFLFI